MKIGVILFGLCLFTFSASASDLSDLAVGYADAFQAMNRTTVTITYVDSGTPTALNNIKEVRAFGGALLIRLTGGDQMILNSGTVLRITQ
jgi:hypothetical protein